MAYNSSKGPQQHGDVKYEGDPLDTQVDFENDFIALKTNGEQRFIVSGSFITSSIPISCSVGITASAYVGDGSGLTNMTGFSPISIYNTAADNRVITSVNSTTVQGEANLTYDGTILKSIGQISASLGISGSTGHFRILNASSIIGGSPLDISASSITITGSLTFSGSSTISASSATISALTASAVSGGSPISIYGDTITMVAGGAGSTAITSAHISSSLPLSASSIYTQTTSSFLGPVGIGILQPLYNLHINGPGVTVATIDGGASSDAFLKFATNTSEKVSLKLGSGGNFLISHLATAGDIIMQAKPGGATTTYLTLDGTRGALTASVAMSASATITAGSFVGDGSGLTNMSGISPIATYNTAVDNRVITSVNSTTVQGEANLTFDGSALAVAGTLAATVANNPVAQLIHPADDVTGAVLELINSKAGNAGDANDFCGGVVFKSKDSTSTATQYGKISTKIGSPTNTSEAGYMLFDITTAGATATTYLRLDGVTSAVTASVAVSASHGITAGSLNTLTTIIDGLHISSSLNISGSKFYGDGSTLSGVTAAPAGSTTQLQYNDAGSVAGSAALTFANGALNTNILTASAAVLVSGSLDVSGSVRGKQLVYTTHAFSDGGGSPYNGYLPFHELTENTNADYRHQMQAPFNGTLKKIVFRPKNAQNGAVTLELWIAGQGDEAIDNGVIAESVTVTMGSSGYTSADFVLSGSNLLVANDIVGIKYTANAAPGNTNVTCIWEYDTLGF